MENNEGEGQGTLYGGEEREKTSHGAGSVAQYYSDAKMG